MFKKFIPQKISFYADSAEQLVAHEAEWHSRSEAFGFTKGGGISPGKEKNALLDENEVLNNTLNHCTPCNIAHLVKDYQGISLLIPHVPLVSRATMQERVLRSAEPVG